MQSTELVTKRCELLREIVPGLRRIAVIGNAGYPAALLEMREVEAATRILGLETDAAEIRRARISRLPSTHSSAGCKHYTFAPTQW